MWAKSKRKDPDSVKGSQGFGHFWGWRLGNGYIQDIWKSGDMLKCVVGVGKARQMRI